jgi:threonine/homoserine/homoserine lactone efflux protein
VTDLLPVLPAFLLAVLVVSATPGPAVALILRRAAVQGWRRTVPLVLGLEAGLFAWAVLAATGLAALIAVSEVAYFVLRVVGAVVLVYLGVMALREAWRARREGRAAPAPEGPAGGHATVPDTVLDTVPGTVPDAGPARPARAFVEGAVTNLANPKAAVFMIAFFPQFIPAGADVLGTTLVLAGLQVGVETVLYLGFAVAVGRAGRWLRSPRVRARIEAVSGAVLLGLGVRVALEPRA